MLYNALNEWALQDYPLVPNQTLGVHALQNIWFADLGVVFGIVSTYDYSQYVYITSISSDTSNVTVTLSAMGIKFVFVIPYTAVEGYCAYVNGTNIANSTTASKYGFGFLQVGNMSTFPTSTTWTGTAQVDPVCVQTLYQHQVNSINIANTPPTTINYACSEWYATGNITSQGVVWFNSSSSFPPGHYNLYYAGGALRFSSSNPWTWAVGQYSNDWLMMTTISSSSAIYGYMPFVTNGVIGWPTQTSTEAHQYSGSIIAQIDNINWAGGPIGVKFNSNCFSSTLHGAPDPTWVIKPVITNTSSSAIFMANIVKSSLTGDVTLAAGNYTDIAVNAVQEAIIFGPSISEFAGGSLNCNNIALLYGSSGLAGPTCAQLLYAINGNEANANNGFTIQGDIGVNVVPIPDGHSIRIEILPLTVYSSTNPLDCSSSSQNNCSSMTGIINSSVILASSTP